MSSGYTNDIDDDEDDIEMKFGQGRKTRKLYQHGVRADRYNPDGGCCSYLNLWTTLVIMTLFTVLGIIIAVNYEANVGNKSDGGAYLLPHYQQFYSGYKGALTVTTNSSSCVATVVTTGRVVIDHYNNPSFGGPRMVYAGYLWIVLACIVQVFIIVVFNRCMKFRLGEQHYSASGGSKKAIQKFPCQINGETVDVEMRWNNWFDPIFLVNHFKEASNEYSLLPTANHYMIITWVPAMYCLNYFQLQMYGINEVVAINAMCLLFGFIQIAFAMGQSHRYKILFWFALSMWTTWWVIVFTAVYYSWVHQQIPNEFQQTAYIPASAAMCAILQLIMYGLTYSHYMKFKKMCIPLRMTEQDFLLGHSPGIITFNTFYQLFFNAAIQVLVFTLLYYGVLSNARVFTVPGLTTTATIVHTGL